jgi:ATP synthase, F1 delta subunit
MNGILVEVLKVVIENEDTNLVNDIFKSFITLSKEKLNIAFVDVTSSAEINNSQQEDITSSLSVLINKKINIPFDVDKTLIGGLPIKVDDTLYDSSLPPIWKKQNQNW